MNETKWSKSKDKIKDIFVFNWSCMVEVAL